MINHDRMFKELFSNFFLEFIELFFPEVAGYIDSGTLEFLDKEVFTDVTSGDQHEVDLLVRAKFKGEDAFFLIHVENQAQPQTNFPRRMFKYFARLHEKHDLPVYPIAVFTYDSHLPMQEEEYRVAFPDRQVLEFRFRAVQLNRLNWRDFVKRENPIASALMAKMNIAPNDRSRVKLECIRLLATLKLNRAKAQIILGFIDTYLALQEEEDRVYEMELEKLSPVEKEQVMELGVSWRDRAMQQGIKLGEEKGIQAGMQAGASAVALLQLERRIGELDEPLRAKIQGLSVEQLEELGLALLDFSDRSDLESWLVAHS